MLIKKRINLAILIIFLICPESIKAAGVEKLICQNIKIIGEHSIDFNETEKKLICGDDSVSEWSNIPAYQAKYLLEIFLQKRGFHNPVFEEKDSLLIVHTGEISLIKNVEHDTTARDISLKRKRRIKNIELTPENLDIIEKWLIEEYRRKGHACPDISLSAFPSKGLVSIDAKPGRKYFLDNNTIEEEKIDDLKKGIIRRYRAFNKKSEFDIDLLRLTEERINLDGIVQHNYFLINCEKDSELLTHRFLPDDPRIFGFGAGFNTEEYFILKLYWRHARLSSTGSSIDISATGSYRQQEFKTEMEWYVLPYPARFHLTPHLSFRREYENNYDTATTKVKLAPATTGDNSSLGIQISGGPAFKYVKVLGGSGLNDSKWLGLEFEFRAMSHDFELHKKDPRSGFQAILNGDLNSSNILSPVTLQKIDFRYTWLFNPLKLSPPLLIFGLRGGIATTITDSANSNLENIPGNYFHYLGGSSNLRGFSRQELPTGDRGALFTVFTGFETRVANFFPFYIEPIVFFDIGALGLKYFDLDKPILYSAGGGIRWASPFGALRITLAHGFTAGASTELSNDVSHFQFYLSFGEEF